MAPPRDHLSGTQVSDTGLSWPCLICSYFQIVVQPSYVFHIAEKFIYMFSMSNHGCVR